MTVNQPKISSFPPVLPENPKVLILGSIPGKKSLEKKQYYGNPRNHFWPIMFRLFEREPVDDYYEKILFIKNHGIALWDTIGACYREGSLDAAITEEEPNNIPHLLGKHPSISLIACNGGKSYTTFKKYFPEIEEDIIKVIKLPSTSPIPGRYTKSFDEKVDAWREILNHI
ncbi:DNA-deoxyinosine glycosylase [Oceanobacillus piezotolerans]|uniref:DNA-deoxyinosine glycosylase n=1 Tax=Oceanobacillus piezotolerans TaxID=2448030 RepID=A0A498D5E6_9BACI|nr:DNA-deoxyinosine glycosylase [Oceanobacillus piezotolerans]RLL44938.1 DNA-deoxyinosine glycosylase [Oceanobacillus piezotolerans]